MFLLVSICEGFSLLFVFLKGSVLLYFIWYDVYMVCVVSLLVEFIFVVSIVGCMVVGLFVIKFVDFGII